MTKLPEPDIVTDHALVRWLERVHGMPMDAFRDHLRGIVADAAKAGAASMTRDGFTYLFSKETGKLTSVVACDGKRRVVRK
jgi:hypothetical protein